MISPTWVLSVVLSAAMFVGLLGIYGAMQTHWPASYVNITTSSGQLGRFSLSWYLFFRMGPTFLVALVTAVSAERLGLSPLFTVTGGLVVYALFVVRHLVRGPRGMSSREKRILVGCFGIGLSLMSGVLALWLKDYLAPIIPQPSALLDAIWTALVVAVIYFAFKRLLDNKVDPASLQDVARRDVGDEMWKYSRAEAERLNVPVPVVQAVLLAEAIQRPRWFRYLERVFQYVQGFFGKEGTTGIAQMRSRRPLRDKESVRLLCDEILKWVGEHPELNSEEGVREYGRHRNDDDLYVNSLVEQYLLLERR